MDPFYGWGSTASIWSHFEEAVRYILSMSILVFQNLLVKLNMQNVQYEILPSVKLQEKTRNSFCTGFTLFKCTSFCYYSEHTGDLGSRGQGVYTPSPQQYLNFKKQCEMEICTQDIPCDCTMDILCTNFDLIPLSSLDDDQ